LEQYSPTAKSREFGVLLAVEGIDGAGKTTQVELLRQALEASGEEVEVSKEPTNGKYGKRIRESAHNGRLHLREELEILIKDRQDHLRRKIRPALEAGKIFVLDRYFYSTIAYQGARFGSEDISWLDKVVREEAPDMVFLLDIDPHVSVERIKHGRNETPNQFERVPYLSQVRQVFNNLADVDDLLWSINGARSEMEIHHTILSLLLQKVLWAKRCYKSAGCADPLHCAPRSSGLCRWWELKETLLSAGDRVRFPALIGQPPEKYPVTV